jgi:2-keto-myo-inositol isomerase
MKLAYHGATSMRSDLVTDIQASARAGFTGLELWATKLDAYLQQHSLAELTSLFKGQRVAPSSINSIEFIAFRGPGYAHIRNRCRELCMVAEAIGCDTLVVVPSPTPRSTPEAEFCLALPWDDVVREYVTVLRDLGDIARPHGVRLAFEFIGFGWCTVRTPRAALEIVEKAAHPNVGMNFDACHFYGGGGLMSEIDALDPARILTFHLNDLEDVPKEALTDGHRLLPGLGILPLTEMASRLQRIGYDGLCSVELFRPEYWEWDPYRLAKAAYESAVSVLSPHFRIE